MTDNINKPSKKNARRRSKKNALERVSGNERLEYALQIGCNLADIRIRNNSTQEETAKVLDINIATYRAYECGHRLQDIFVLHNFAEHFNTNLSEIIPGCPAASETGSLVPLFRRITKETDLTKSEYPNQYETTSLKPSRGGSFFALTVASPDMSPVLKKGDVAIFETSDFILPGHIVLASIDDREAVIYKYHEQHNCMCFYTLNYAETPIWIDIKDISRVKIIGKLVEMKRQLENLYYYNDLSFR